MGNVGIVDRLMRFVALHLVISIVDAGIVEGDLLNYFISTIGFYLVLTAIIGIDPIYSIAGFNTKENAINKKTPVKND